MDQAIKVFVQPPSPKTPTVSNNCLDQRKGIGSMLPSVDALFPPTEATHNTKPELPRLRLTIGTDVHHLSPITSPVIATTASKKLETIEPNLNRSPSDVSSPLLLSSPSPSPVPSYSPSSSLWSPLPSPLITPMTNEHTASGAASNNTTTSGAFLLPPPAFHTATSSESPLYSPLSLSPLCLSPPLPNTTELSSISSKEDQASLFPSLSTTITAETSPPPTISKRRSSDPICHAFGGPVKRRRGRPSNASRQAQQPRESTHPTNWIFVEPTVWNVKHSQREIDSIRRELKQIKTNQDTQQQQQYTSNEVTSMFTTITTSSITELNIPKKKRGRKPKQQMVGNGCFVWKDLTAPRGANKKK